MKATNVDKFGSHPPGSCRYLDGILYFACPGCGLWGGCRVGNPKPADTPSWEIVNGDPKDATTLTLIPSILAKCCGWHGYLKNGVFEPC